MSHKNPTHSLICIVASLCKINGEIQILENSLYLQALRLPNGLVDAAATQLTRFFTPPPPARPTPHIMCHANFDQSTGVIKIQIAS